MTEWEDLGAAYREQLWTQQYGSRSWIDGVQLLELTVFADEGGDFCELSRFAPDGTLAVLPGYRSAQLSYSFMEPGTVKAWHLHRYQDDLWFVPPHDRLLVGLVDLREASATYETSMRLVLGAGRARLLLIPRGVAHGVANLSPQPASLLYFSNHPFNPEQPDEHRLPPDLLGGDFWTNRAG